MAKLQAKPVGTISESTTSESTFRWVIAKFSDEFRKLSPEFELQGFPFQLELRKIRTT